MRVERDLRVLRCHHLMLHVSERADLSSTKNDGFENIPETPRRAVKRPVMVRSLDDEGPGRERPLVCVGRGGVRVRGGSVIGGAEAGDAIGAESEVKCRVDEPAMSCSMADGSGKGGKYDSSLAVADVACRTGGPGDVGKLGVAHVDDCKGVCGRACSSRTSRPSRSSLADIRRVNSSTNRRSS